MRGTSYRLPRKVKKAYRAIWRRPLTTKQADLLARCLVLHGHGGWSHVRRANAHVAMGDTSSLRRRERQARVRARYEALEDRALRRG
jgi:hypothetical protein